MLHNCNEVEKLVACPEYVAITRGKEEREDEGGRRFLAASLSFSTRSACFPLFKTPSVPDDKNEIVRSILARTSREPRERGRERERSHRSGTRIESVSESTIGIQRDFPK